MRNIIKLKKQKTMFSTEFKFFFAVFSHVENVHSL